MTADGRRIRQAALIGAAISLAFCSACRSEEHDADKGSPVNVASAVCAKDAAAKQVSLPSGFPADFPMPPGTRLYAVDNRGPDGIVVTGVTGTPFKSVLSSLQTGLPAHGYTPKDGETEPHDAESNWTSAGYEGRWAIREIPQCSGETLVNVVARAKSSAAPSG
ncbi:MAG: hypothetical protein ACJ74U_00025 [Jatrophihabitantaceae bacterium]